MLVSNQLNEQTADHCPAGRNGLEQCV